MLWLNYNMLFYKDVSLGSSTLNAITFYKKEKEKSNCKKIKT